MPPRLTALRIRLLVLIAQLTRQLGGPPSAAELAHAAGVGEATISFHLKALQALGYTQPRSGRERLKLTDEGREAAGDGIPIYGQIAAGQPILAEQAPDRVVPSLDVLLGVRPGDYLLEVRGQSMTGVGIMDGDFVLVRPGGEVLDGEVAVVLLDNVSTLKRLYRLHDLVILRSENPEMPQLSFPAERVTIQGKLVGRIGGTVPRLSFGSTR